MRRYLVVAPSNPKYLLGRNDFCILRPCSRFGEGYRVQGQSMELQYRIVFSGRIREGLRLETVRSMVAARLSATPAQVERIFCGKRIILKNGLSAEAGRKYVERLERLGMVMSLEPVPAHAVAAVATVSPPAPAFNTPVPAPVHERPVITAEPGARPADETWLSSSSFADLARTYVNLARAEAMLNGTEEPSEASGDEPWVTKASEPSVRMPEPASAPAAVSEPEEAPSQSKGMAEAEPPKESPVSLAMHPGSGQENSFVFNGSFACTHCGTVHHLTANIRIASDPESAPA
jgi:hypothetical protein